MAKETSRSRRFDIDDPDLPPGLKKAALTSNSYPYSERMERDEYEDQLIPLQVELVKLMACRERAEAARC